MKVLVCYLSGTGNTKKIAELYVRSFEKHNCTVALCDVCKDTPDFSDFNLLAVGYPIHAFNAPKKVFTFVNGLPESKQNCFIFKTSGEPLTLNDSSSNLIVKKLKSKGYSVLQEHHYVMPYNIIVRHNDNMVKQMLTEANIRVAKNVDSLLKGERKRIKQTSVSRLFAALFRIEWAGGRIIGKTFHSTRECSLCTVCEKNCPTKNVSVVNGKTVFGRKCILCMRCVMNCPQNCIKTGILSKWRVNGVYDFERIEKDETLKGDFINENTRGLYALYKPYFKK